MLAIKGAKNAFAAIEDLSGEELEKLHDRSRARLEMLMENLEHRRARTNSSNHTPRAAAHRAKSPCQPSHRGAKA